MNWLGYLYYGVGGLMMVIIAGAFIRMVIDTIEDITEKDE
jgi:hypothetical protein